MKVKLEWNANALLRGVERGEEKAVRAAAAYVRTVARRSIKTGRNPSPRGRPPHTLQGQLRRAILFAQKNNWAIIGPSAALLSDIGGLHEHGGSRTQDNTQLLQSGKIPGTNWVLKVGGHGPIRGKPKVAFAKLDTAAQVRRSKEIAARDDLEFDSYQARKARMVQRLLKGEARTKTVYPERPFMGPALAKSAPRISSFWKDAVK